MPADEIVAIRSMTNLIWCAGEERLHEMLEEPVNYAELLARLDATTDCGPHTLQPLRYPFFGAGFALDTPEGTFGVGLFVDDLEEFKTLFEAGEPVPWAIITPDNHVYPTSVPPGMVASIFAEFSGVRMFGALGVNVDDAYNDMANVRARIDVLEGRGLIDAADQQL